MCVICGCNADQPAGHAHLEADAARVPAALGAVPAADLHYGVGAAKMSLPGMSPTRAIELEADVLGANDRLAARNRAHFAAHGVTAYNLLSSPGSGKTSLLCATIEALRVRRAGLRLAVIEGDQQTSLDAQRIRAAGAPAIQVNTGRGCHLDAQMVGDAFDRLDLHAHAHHHQGEHPPSQPDGVQALLFIENVGNLVCPAMWDLGEAAKVVILSVTEGDDKPLKYPDAFAAAALMLINKIDLLPHVRFDVAQCIAHARRVNPGIEVLQVSATRGDGLDAWLAWLLPHADLGPGRTPQLDAAHAR
jgi:hydrogenase nickel incorporation protein HypB